MVGSRLLEHLGNGALGIRTAALGVYVFAVMAGHAPTPAIANDDCCGDLEARVAELEATIVDKGNRKINLELAGAVSRAILFWDDGADSDAYVVTNDGEGSKIEFTGEAEHLYRTDWSAGFHIEINVQGSGSGEVNQLDAAIPTELQTDESLIWVRHEKAGQLTWGSVGGTGENINDLTEADLSDTALASYSGVEDIGGGFFLRQSNVKGISGLLPVVWEDLIDHLPGIDGDIVRYDTPFWRGFQANGAVGSNKWQLALNWSSEPEEDAEENPELAEVEVESVAKTTAYPAQRGLLKVFHISATIGLFDIRNEVNDGNNGVEGPDNNGSEEPDSEGPDSIKGPDSRTVAGSLSVLHKPTGLSLTGATARRKFTSSVELNDGEEGRPSDPWYYYLKAGWIRNFNTLGKTAFYAEYGNFNQFLGRDADTEMVAALGGIDEDAVCVGPDACLVSGSNATIWGLGVVQFVEKADLQLYIGYRHYEPDIRLVDSGGAGVRSVSLSDFDTVITGALIDF